MERIKKTEKTQNTVIAGLTRNLLPIIATLSLFLFFPCTGAIAQAQAQASSLPSGRLLSGQLPSTNYLQAATLANIPSPGITTAGRELLFGPPTLPPTGGDGGGPAVGEAPVTDVLWLLILCCLMYGFRKENFHGHGKKFSWARKKIFMSMKKNFHEHGNSETNINN